MHISDRLFKTKPSFLAGMAAIIYCRGPVRSQRLASGAEVDAAAIGSDWIEIGKDMYRAISSV